MASRTVGLIRDQNVNVHYNGASLVGKANIATAPRKGAIGGRKPLGDLSNSVNPILNQTSKKENSKILSFGGVGLDFGSYQQIPQMASRIVSLIQDQNLNVQFNGKANISKAPRKASTGGRKPLGDLSNSVNPTANGNVASKLSDTCWEKDSLLGKGSCIEELTSEIACFCNQTKCWQCLPAEIMKSGLLIYFINMNWEYAHRKLLVRILTGTGKCLGYGDQTHEIHEGIWQSMSVLVSRNAYTQTCSSAHRTFLLDLIGRETVGDTFAIEGAAILYRIGGMTLKGFHSKVARIDCCDLSKVQLSKTVHWLKLAFVLCREVPVLFQKVSRLLSAIYLLSATSEHFTLPSCKALSESHWASYFHQASLGTHLIKQFFPSTSGRSNAQRFVDSGDLNGVVSSCVHTETSILLRLAPESVNDLEQFVMNFYVGLPATAIICISLLGHDYTNLLQELLLYPSSIHARMRLSRLNSKNQPVVLLLPLDSV